MSLFLAGTGIVAPKYFAPAARSFSSELTLLPPTQVGDQQYLNLTCIHPSAYRIVTKVLDVAMDGRTLFDFHAQASPSEFDLVMRSCGHLLARGYSEGLRSTLAVHIPELYGMARDVPRLTQPWILMNREISGVDSIRITWTRLNYSVMGEAALLVAEDDANSRRQRARQCATTRSRKAR